MTCLSCGLGQGQPIPDVSRRRLPGGTAGVGWAGPAAAPSITQIRILTAPSRPLCTLACAAAPWCYAAAPCCCRAGALPGWHVLACNVAEARFLTCAPSFTCPSLPPASSLVLEDSCACRPAPRRKTKAPLLRAPSRHTTFNTASERGCTALEELHEARSRNHVASPSRGAGGPGRNAQAAMFWPHTWPHTWLRTPCSLRTQSFPTLTAQIPLWQPRHAPRNPRQWRLWLSVAPQPTPTEHVLQRPSGSVSSLLMLPSPAGAHACCASLHAGRSSRQRQGLPTGRPMPRPPPACHFTGPTYGGFLCLSEAGLPGYVNSSAF